MAVVDEVAKTMSSTLDIDHIYDRFALEIKKLVDFDRATLIEIERTANSYTIRNTWGLEIPSMQPGSRFTLDGSSIEMSLATGNGIFTNE